MKTRSRDIERKKNNGERGKLENKERKRKKKEEKEDGYEYILMRYIYSW